MLVHGFTQTLRCWDDVASRLAPLHEVVRVDLPGHGGSAAERLSFVHAASALAEVGGSSAYVGYSMGGRLALRAALDHPDHVGALVLVGASPGLASAVEREARRRADEAWIEILEGEGVDGFLETWLAQPIFATLPPESAGLEHRRANAAEGLADALRLLGTGVQEPLWERLSELTIPTLLVAGEGDEKFVALAREMAQRIGSAAEVALIPGAGHAAHLERPDAFTQLLVAFLAAHHPATP
ncbi:MAG: alpha/beta fold hydrolase [Actinobacteria bacterium]|nr:alpha/beta fold hydrolase [Actinomycetota bacterium]